MFRSFLTLVLLGLTVSWSRSQEAPLQYYINKGNATNPVVNALNFVNEGRFTVSSEIPWDPQNTINFTNRGTIIGSVGFNFETVDGGFGLRHPAQSFFNAPNGTIAANDPAFVLFGSGNQGQATSGTGGFIFANASFLKINALNVTNKGDLTIGGSGVMTLFGQEMDLSGGTMIVEDLGSAFFGFGFGVLSETNFFPSTAVYDQAYGVASDTNMLTAGIILSTNPNTILTPGFNITNVNNNFFFGVPCPGNLLLQNAQAWTRDEFADPSNRVVQVIAVDTGDTNINVFASFLDFVLPGGAPANGFLSPIVEFRVLSTNFRTLDLQTNSLYVLDQLGSHTNYALSSNIVAGTFRPAAIIVARDTPGLGELGSPGLPFVDPDIFDNPAYSNRIVTNQYAVYAASVESVAAQLPLLPDVGVTNLPGRVEINATDLRLDNTRIRGDGLISINATNLTSGQSSVLDVPRINMNFNSTQRVLDLKDMTPDSVERFGGFLQAFAATWTNQYSEVVGSGTNAVTNVITVTFELFAVQAHDLHTREPVVAYDLKLGSPGDVIYEDNLSVTNLLQINAPNVTFAEGSRLFLGKGLGFSYTNLANVLNFTNLGTLQVNELAELRNSESVGYNTFVNRGSLLAFGTDITASYFENTGDITSSNFYTLVETVTIGLGGGGLGTGVATDCFGEPVLFPVAEGTEGAITINASTAKIDAGTFTTLGDVQFNGGVFKINNHRAIAGGRMVLNVTDILTDSGDQAGNVWQVSNGLAMGARPGGGDLLGTEIQVTASKLAFVENYWSAEDRGASVDGFSDNVAIGRLLIRGDTGSRFQFLPGAPNSALYADVLQIDGLQASSIREFTNRVVLGMNVYYGNIESTNSNLTAESLNGILGPTAPYNFIWVPSWAGPNSGVDVPLTENGPVRRFNIALRESALIDSDGDGLPNRYDPFPFPPEDFGITGITLNPSSNVVSFGFTAQTVGTYIIEYTTNLAAPNWQELQEILQKNSSGGTLSFTDELRAGDPQRYYRVRKAP